MGSEIEIPEPRVGMVFVSGSRSKFEVTALRDTSDWNVCIMHDESWEQTWVKRTTWDRHFASGEWRSMMCKSCGKPVQLLQAYSRGPDDPGLYHHGCVPPRQPGQSMSKPEMPAPLYSLDVANARDGKIPVKVNIGGRPVEVWPTGNVLDAGALLDEMLAGTRESDQGGQRLAPERIDSLMRWCRHVADTTGSASEKAQAEADFAALHAMKRGES